MANSTDKSILTAAGKALLAQLNAEEKALVIDKMIFANVPNRPEYPQPDDVVPTDHIVHQEQVEQRGRLSADSVIYSSTLTSDVGPFDFNWTGTYCSEYGVLVTIDHHALTPKTADEPGVAGNTLVRSVVLEYKDIAEITNITVDASSWQYNATERMKKMDSDVAQSIIDQNGKDWFIEDGFLVTPSGSAYSIKAGAGYVSGNRVAMEFDRSVQVPNKPSFIYIDAHREGTPTGEQVTLFNFVVTAEEKDDYIDSSTGKDVKHFVCKIAQVHADGSVSDLRPKSITPTVDYTLLNAVAKANHVRIEQVAFLEGELLNGVSVLYDKTSEITYFSLVPLSGQIDNIGEDIGGIRELVIDGNTFSVVSQKLDEYKTETFQSQQHDFVNITPNAFRSYDVISNHGSWEFVCELTKALRNGYNPIGWGVDIKGEVSSHQAWNKIVSDTDKIIGDPTHVYRFSEVVTVLQSNKDFNLGGAEVRWNGVAPAFDHTGRDRGVFEFKGSVGEVIDSVQLQNTLKEFAEKYPTTDAVAIAIRKWVVLGCGSLPNRAFSLMVQPDDTATGNEISVDYVNGWEYPVSSFLSYRAVTPIENCDIYNFKFIDETNHEDNADDISAIVFQYAYNCHAKDIEPSKTNNPIVFGHYCHTCTATKITAKKPNKVTPGMGYIAQWNNSIYCGSAWLRGTKVRHTNDFTQSAYCYVNNCGAVDEADGAFVTHGAYEHDLVYEKVYGVLSFANSGEQFGQSCKRINVNVARGSRLIAATNVIDLSLKDAYFESAVLNCVGLVLEKFHITDLNAGVLQINNWSRQLGKPEGDMPKRADIKASVLINKDPLKRMFDQGLTIADEIKITNSEISLNPASIFGGDLKFDDCVLKATHICTLQSPDDEGVRLVLRDCRGFGFGIRFLDQTVPTSVKIFGGEYTGNNTSGFWVSKRDVNGNAPVEFVCQGATVDWGGSHVIEDNLDPEKSFNNKYTEMISGNNFKRGIIQLPTDRNNNGSMNYGGNVIGKTVTEQLGVTSQNRVISQSARSPFA
ncbi:phage tail protein [Vibrio parahaemolyticus]|uniref:phage tail-collar fiber domain-containing protein n=1 Tax=Vibrio parahaemolyticus TaxID=670 RepID=UPI0030F0820E